MYDERTSKFEGLGLAHNFCTAWLKTLNGGTPNDLRSLMEDRGLLIEVVQIVRGEHPTFVYNVDLDAEVPSHLWAEAAMVRTAKYGAWIWNEAEIRIIDPVKEYGERAVNDGLPIKNCKFDKPANAALLDFIIRRQGVLRDEKKWDTTKRFLFLGTVYHSGPERPSDEEVVLTMYRGTDYHHHWVWQRSDCYMYQHVTPKDRFVVLS